MTSTARSLRKAVWLVRISLAAFLGWTTRYWGKAFRKPPRILHGTYPMHTVKSAVEMDRLAGFPSRSVVYHASLAPYALVKSSDFDTVLAESGHAWDELHWAALSQILRHADIWVSCFDSSFSHDERLQIWFLKLIRVAGIRIIVMTNGLDVVCVDGRKTRYDWVDCARRDYPDWDIAGETPSRRRRIDSFCRYASFVIAENAASRRFLPRVDRSFTYHPVGVDLLDPVFNPENPVPVIVHAPNHRHLKGTAFLLEATERLKARGFSFELRIVERVTHDEAIAIYRAADILADQFIIGAPGVLTLEGMSLGKPVLTYLDQEHLGDPVFNIPVVNTTPENLECVLAILLTLPQLRERLGRTGRDAMERYASNRTLAGVWTRIYSHLWRGEPLGLEETLHFSADRKPRSFTEDPLHTDFWPVPVDDLLDSIHDISTRLKGGLNSCELSRKRAQLV